MKPTESLAWDPRAVILYGSHYAAGHRTTAIYSYRFDAGCDPSGEETELKGKEEFL